MAKWKVTTRLVENTRSIADNSRGHNITLDLPVAQGGDNEGPTALELVLMSLAGCAVTIYADIAKRSKVPINKLVAEVEAEKSSSLPIVISLKMNVQGKASKTMLETMWRKTEVQCPVMTIFTQATPIKVQLETVSE